jgi:hypothetical protein
MIQQSRNMKRGNKNKPDERLGQLLHHLESYVEHRGSAAKPAQSERKAGFVCCIPSFCGCSIFKTPPLDRLTGRSSR